MSDSNNTEQLAAVLEDELFNFCLSDSLSEEGLRQIIERHGLTTHNNNHLEDYDFFFQACFNERVTEEIIRYLLEYFPDAASKFDGNEWMPLHAACNSKSATLQIIQLLIDAAPDSVSCVTNYGDTTLHILCKNIKRADEIAARQILKFLLEKHPEAVRHSDNRGRLPIHYANWRGSPEFCRVLIEAYPGSERITDGQGALPLHHACLFGSLAVVEYSYERYPDAIDHGTNGTGGLHPIHMSILRTPDELVVASEVAAVKITQFLLDCNPNQTLIQSRGKSLLHFACGLQYNDSNIGEAIQIIKAIFDAHPEAIEHRRIAQNIQRYHQKIQAFINSELVYARQAQDRILMTTPDVYHGWLPLHTALQNNVRLGSIKLLVKGNPAAVQYPDNSGALPLHVACQHHDCVSVIQYLLSLDEAVFNAVDRQGNTTLHYACCGAKHDTIALLLEKYDAASVSKRNAHGKLPIDLLWGSNEANDRESLEYTGSVFQLLKAYPEMLMISSDTKCALLLLELAKMHMIDA